MTEEISIMINARWEAIASDRKEALWLTPSLMEIHESTNNSNPNLNAIS